MFDKNWSFKKNHLNFQIKLNMQCTYVAKYLNNEEFSLNNYYVH